MVDLGEKVRFLRKKSNLTQSQLAEIIGVTKSMVSSYETSIRLPSYDVLIKLAYTFKVTTDYLLGIDKRDTIDMLGLSEKQKQALYNLIEVFME